MKTQEWHFADKSDWPAGRWHDEPDKRQWTDEHTGLPCLAVRHRSSGHWCGYVGVAEGHPYFEQGYDDCDVGVHGGLTFANFCVESDKEHGVCHIVEDGENDRVWWLGFDCVHSGDLSPGHKHYFPWNEHERYRSLRYVELQCMSLAAQLSNAQDDQKQSSS